MSDFAVLLTGEAEQPTVVRLQANSDSLELVRTYGPTENIAWWRLYRVDEDRSMHRFRRLDRRNWELRVMSGADQALLAHVRRAPLFRLLHPLRRLEALKIVAGLVVLLLTVAQHAPPELLAKAIPGWAQDRLVDGVIADDAPRRCSRDGGEAVIRKLLVRLDPVLGRQVEIVALRNSGFVVSATPGKHIFMMQSSMTEIDPLALPALLAHQLSHVRHDDAIVAILRENGFLKTWAAIFEGNPGTMLQMRFSGLEERRADLEAMQMMRNAAIPIQPAAKMFDDFRQSKEQGGYFGYDQRDFHFGIDARVQRWAAAARLDPPNAPPVLTDAEEGEVFNFCWNGPVQPLPKGARQAPAVATSPGEGTIGTQQPPPFRDPR